jgi:hypothetical protein
MKGSRKKLFFSSAVEVFFSPHDLYYSGRFLAGTEPDLVDDTENIHPTLEKSTRTSFLKGHVSFICLLTFLCL